MRRLVDSIYAAWLRYRARKASVKLDWTNPAVASVQVAIQEDQKSFTKPVPYVIGFDSVVFANAWLWNQLPDMRCVAVPGSTVEAALKLAQEIVNYFPVDFDAPDNAALQEAVERLGRNPYAVASMTGNALLRAIRRRGKLLIHIGGNDIAMGRPFDKILNDLQKLVAVFESVGIQVGWLEILPLGNTQQNAALTVSCLRFIELVRAAKFVEVVRLRFMLAGPDGFIRSEWDGPDHLHPNALGVQGWFPVIWNWFYNKK